MYSTEGTLCTLEELYTQITTDPALKTKTELYRQGRIPKKELPTFTPSGIFSQGRTDKHITKFTGYMMIDYDHLYSKHNLDQFMEAIDDQRGVVMAYRTASGKGVRVIINVLILFPSGTYLDFDQLSFSEDTSDNEQLSLVWKAAWHKANQMFSETVDSWLFAAKYDRSCSNISRCSVMAYDPDAIFHPMCGTWIIPLDEAYTDYLDSIKQNQLPQAQHKSTGRRIGRPATNDTQRAFDAAEAAAQAHGKQYRPHMRNSYITYALYEVNRYGVSEQEARQEACRRWWDYGEGNEGVTSIVHSIYQTHAHEHGSRPLKNSKSDRKEDKNTGIMASIQAFLQEQGDFRHNSLTQSVEVKWHKGSAMQQLVMNDDVNRWSLATANHPSENQDIYRELRNTDLATLISLYNSQAEKPELKESVFRTIIESRLLAPEYNPFIQYLLPLKGKWQVGDHDYILELLQNIRVKGDEGDQRFFYDVATRWIVAMVNGWINHSSTHGTILTFIGAQGAGKSTWFEQLLPPELRRYKKTQTRYTNLNKDDIIALAENGLIVLEEIDAMKDQDANRLKAMSSMSQIKERAPYKPLAENRERIATFAATGNRSDFLTDPTGNRRWLPFEIVSFVTHPKEYHVNYEGIYSQALYLAQHGHEIGWKHWFDREEIDRLNRHNQDFTAACAEVELCSSYVRAPRQDLNGLRIEEGQWLSSSQIAAYIKTYCHIDLNLQRLGYHLRKCQYDTKKEHNVSKYYVVLVNPYTAPPL